MKRVAAIALVAACGQELHHTVDAQPADSAIDSLAPSTDDAPTEAVKLVIKRGTSTVPNVAVFFQDPSSGLIEQKLTNENGLAWALMPAGGFVSAVEHVGNGVDEITTFAAVASGDSLRLDFMNPGQTTQWPITLSFAPDSAGAGSYTFRSSCDSESMGVIHPVPVSSGENQFTLTGCGDGTADFAILSYDNDGLPTGRGLYVPSVTLPFASPGTFPSVQLTGDFTMLEGHTLEYTNVPETISAVSALQGISATRRAYDVTTTEPRTSSTVTLGTSVPAGASTQLTVSIGFPTSTEKGQPTVIDWGAASATYSLDLAASTLPRYESAPAYAASTRTVTWSEAATGVQPDLVRARIHAFRDGIPATRSWGWRIVAPRTAAPAVTYPQLPVVDFDFNPTDTDTVGVDELTNVKLPGGYAALKPAAFGNINNALSGASGRIVVETLYVPEL